MEASPGSVSHESLYKGAVSTTDENGLFHSENDQPARIRANGTQEWYQHGYRHRDNGPAIIYRNGTEVWYNDGLCHREDGPAVIMSDGMEMWYLNNEIVQPDTCQKNVNWKREGF